MAEIQNSTQIDMPGAAILDREGRLVWSNWFLPGFSAEACLGRRLDELSFGEYAERFRQQFAMVRTYGHECRDRIGFRDPVSGVVCDFDLVLMPAPDSAVICRFEPAPAVRLVNPVEEKILQLVCRDWSNQQIASALRCSESSVSNYRKSLRERFKLTGHSGEVLLAVRLRLVDVPGV